MHDLLRHVGPLATAVLAGTAVMAGGPAFATTPSRLWWGVERVVLACEVDAGAQQFEASICAAAKAHLQSHVTQPVMVRADATGGDPAADLILTVSARSTRPGGLELTVRPKRIEIMNQAPSSLVTTVEGDADTPAALAALVAKSLAKIVPAN